VRTTSQLKSCQKKFRRPRGGLRYASCDLYHRCHFCYTPAFSNAKVSHGSHHLRIVSTPDAFFVWLLSVLSACLSVYLSICLFARLQRVCKPKSEGGRVLLLEHSRIDDDEEDGGDGRGRRRMLPKILAAYQDLTAAPIAAMGKGCVWNQRLEPLLASAGLEVLSSTRVLGGLLTVIEATRRG